jgi:dihydroorotate dehydrogenase (NAD+) catalytic subunit
MFSLDHKQIKIGDKNFNLIMNASGCRSKTKEQLHNLIHNGMNTIVCKTCTLLANDGNPEPNFQEINDNLSINCLGMPNYGYQYYRDLYLEYKKLNVTYIISMDASNWNELQHMLLDYDRYIGIHGINNQKEFVEINASCPNKLDMTNGQTSRIIAFDPILLARLLENIKNLDLQYITIGLKLSPYIDKYLLDDISKVIIIYSSIVYYIVCGNSIPNGMIIDSDTKKPVLSVNTGGISGTTNKLLSISNIYQFLNIFKKNINKLKKPIHIIGCGGIETSDDVLDYINTGASCVQIGRVLYINGVSKVSDIANTLLSKL